MYLFALIDPNNGSVSGCMLLYLFVYLSLYLSVYLYVCLSICLSVCLSVCESVSLSICHSICSLTLFVCTQAAAADATASQLAQRTASLGADRNAATLQLSVLRAETNTLRAVLASLQKDRLV